MRHDYTLMQNRILTQIIDKLQFAIKEVISSYKKTKSEDINNTTLFTSSEYYDPAHPDSLKLKIYIQEFGLPPSSYEQLKESLRNISTIPVEIPYYENGRKWVSIEGLCKIEMPDDIRTRTDYINVRITKKTATYMLSVSSGYTKYIKQTIMMAKNSYTPKLYLLLCMYRDKESKVIQNTVGNIFSGQVVGETAKTLSERFGKVLQQRQSMTINRNDKSTSISTQLDSLIPASKISNLTQGMFVGAVSDNFEERIEQKIFHCEIVVDNSRVAEETKTYQEIPDIMDFVDENGNDTMQEEIENNYRQIKQDIKELIENEMERIKNDDSLKHIYKKNE